MTFPFLKGHGTRNDFVVLPDLDGSVHGDLDPDLVRRLCDRRGGIGADGVLRVLSGDIDGGADFFMDHRNADGSVSDMCGNGLRVFARYLERAGLVDPARPLAVDTRDGIKDVVFQADGDISIDMGRPKVGPQVKVEVDGRLLDATAVDTGNPHAVALVDALDVFSDRLGAPRFEAADFPAGVNVELIVSLGGSALAMRVYERGVGETQSCGTGACAAVVAIEHQRGGRTGTPYRVEVPGGTLTVTWEETGHVRLAGPAVLVAEGTWNG